MKKEKPIKRLVLLKRVTPSHFERVYKLAVKYGVDYDVEKMKEDVQEGRILIDWEETFIGVEI